MCVCVGPMWWAAGCELSRPLTGQQEKDENRERPFFFSLSLSVCLTFISSCFPLSHVCYSAHSAFTDIHTCQPRHENPQLAYTGIWDQHNDTALLQAVI